LTLFGLTLFGLTLFGLTLCLMLTARHSREGRKST